MGSVVALDKAPLEIKSAIIQALAKFEDYNFIVKVGSADKQMAELASNVKNVYLESWVPQVDLLGANNDTLLPRDQQLDNNDLFQAIPMSKLLLHTAARTVYLKQCTLASPC